MHQRTQAAVRRRLSVGVVRNVSVVVASCRGSFEWEESAITIHISLKRERDDNKFQRWYT